MPQEFDYYMDVQLGRCIFCDTRFCFGECQPSEVSA